MGKVLKNPKSEGFRILLTSCYNGIIAVVLFGGWGGTVSCMSSSGFLLTKLSVFH